MSRHMRLLKNMNSPRRRVRRLKNRINRIRRRRAEFRANHPWSDPNYRSIAQDVASSANSIWHP